MIFAQGVKRKVLLLVPFKDKQFSKCESLLFVQAARRVKVSKKLAAKAP
ncbi:MAG: hypothetical protein Q4P84_07085 [Elusimicrobiales bacterium]|nr:hypothetical protein [Elusimicrobiales bacterium]